MSNIKNKKIYDCYDFWCDKRKTQHLWREPYIIQRSIAPFEIIIGDKTYINFSSNDYLGLSQHEILKNRAASWSYKYGVGSTASRLVCGNLNILQQVEEKLADFKGREAAIIKASGYQTNLSVISALMNREVLGNNEVIAFCDRLNHASIYAGIKLSGASMQRYHHLDYDDLTQKLENTPDHAHKFIISESVFSMDGDVADMQKLSLIGNGVMGEQGRGVTYGHYDIDLVIGTFSKAFGSFGGYVACSKNLKNYLMQKSGGLIYSTSVPPSMLGAIDAALDIIPFMNTEREKLHLTSQKLRDIFYDHQLNYAQSVTNIVPLIIKDTVQTLELAKKFQDNGIFVLAFRPPTVPHNTTRLRFSLTPFIEEEHLNIIKDTLTLR
jgi:8-amino-7-oxononanoate synthase